MTKNTDSGTLESLVSSEIIKPFEKLSDAYTGEYHNIDKILINGSFDKFDRWHEHTVEAFKKAGKTPEEKKELKEVGEAFAQSASVMHNFGKNVERKLNGAAEKIEKIARSIETGIKDLFGHVSDWLSGKTNKKGMIQEIKKTTEEVVKSAPLTTKEKIIIQSGYAVAGELAKSTKVNMDKLMQEMKEKQKSAKVLDSTNSR